MFFYYNVLKKGYDDKIKLLFTDTDSLCVEIETDDVYKDTKEQKEYYDFSEYPKDHFYIVQKIKQWLKNLKMK